MENRKNDEKKIKVIAKKRKSNNEYKTSMRTAMKNVEKAILANDKDKANDALGVAIKRLDKATSKGVVTKNFCARNKSRLTKKVSEMK